MPVFLSPVGNYFPSTGTSLVLLNGGLLNTYAAGTSTSQATFTSSSGSVTAANPIVLGVDGRPSNEIWLTGGQSYKFILQDSLANLIGTYDNLYGIGDPQAPNASQPQLLTGVAGTNTITVSGPSISVYSLGQSWYLVPVATNTGAVTLNINSVGARNVFVNGGALVGGELKNGNSYILEDDGTRLNLIGGLAGFANQNANTFLAGPVSGVSVAPAFRAIVGGDMYITAAQSFLSADVPLTVTTNYVNVLSTGTIGSTSQVWIINASVNVIDTLAPGSGSGIRFRIQDGVNTNIETGFILAAANIEGLASFNVLVTPNTPTNYILSVKDATTSGGKVQTSGTNATTPNKATSILAVRIL